MGRSIQLAFGKQGLRLELPDGFEYLVLDTKSAAPLDDATAEIERALDNPTRYVPQRDLATGQKSAAISVCDITRPAPNRIVLPPVLRRLEQAGIPREGITILIATGLHRAATAGEIREIVGEEIASRYRVENHDARRDADHVHLGATQGGTPIYIDRRFVEADVRMSLGFIEPHLMAGFSGGRKLVVPGLAGHRTIRTIHSPRFMRETAAIEGSI
jgi:nickel-dependent lactate racemase